MSDFRITIHYHSPTCIGCDNHVSHDQTLKVIKDDEGYWIAQGPCNTEQEAIERIEKTKEMVEAKGKTA